MPPIDLFDRILISDALGKCKRPTKLLLGLGTRECEFTSPSGRHSHPEQTRATRTNKKGAPAKNLTLRQGLMICFTRSAIHHYASLRQPLIRWMYVFQCDGRNMENEEDPDHAVSRISV